MDVLKGLLDRMLRVWKNCIWVYYKFKNNEKENIGSSS